MKLLFISIALVACLSDAFSQGCCSGGGGNPLAGNTSTGVLAKNQFEIRQTYQYFSSNRFLSGDSDTLPFFDNISSNYFFTKADYGLTEKFTLSLATGYYLDRTIRELLPEGETEHNYLKSGGWGDLMFLPRYNVFTKTVKNVKSELTAGVGMKFPIGSHNDSVSIGYSYFLNMEGGTPFIDSMEIFQTLPPTIQATTGSTDGMFFLNYLRAYNRQDLRLFATAFYILKGWNSLGQKFGDFASLSVSADKTLFGNLGLMIQLNGEHNGRLKSSPAVDQLALYGIELASTGSFKLSVLPQLHYTIGDNFTLFVNGDIPLYQYMNGTQVAAQYQFTGGVNYRFYTNRKHRPLDTCSVVPPVALNDSTFKVWGNCDMCKEKIEKTVIALKGVDYAKWDPACMMLTVYYDEGRIRIDEIARALADVGYDTEMHRAEGKVYDSLPACCRYERP